MINLIGKYCIVRTNTAGVFAGVIDARDGSRVQMSEARRLWYWDGAASLSQLAVEGVAKPKTCKFPAVVPLVELLETVEIIPTTAKARKCIEDVPVWNA